MIRLTVNGKQHEIDVDGETPLLWVLRDHLGLTGTKYGCGIAQCGACTVHLDGEAVQSCVTPAGQAVGKAITTIEGLSSARTHPVQRAWIEEEVPQCGFCQSGQIMTAASLLSDHPQPSDEQINEVMSRVLCRCGTYNRVRRAVRRAAGAAKQKEA